MHDPNECPCCSSVVITDHDNKCPKCGAPPDEREWVRRRMEAARKSGNCLHENHIVNAAVNRLVGKETEGFAWSADIKINCAGCGIPFEFIGVGMGLSPDKPMASVDFLELRVPITPKETHVATLAPLRYPGFFATFKTTKIEGPPDGTQA